MTDGRAGEFKVRERNRKLWKHFVFRPVNAQPIAHALVSTNLFTATVSNNTAAHRISLVPENSVIARIVELSQLNGIVLKRCTRCTREDDSSIEIFWTGVRRSEHNEYVWQIDHPIGKIPHNTNKRIFCLN